eukprot:Clim_evm3s146 gene=Clim_evmTU3s146
MDGDNLHGDLPLTFQSEVSLAMNRDLIAKVPLFKTGDIGFLRMLPLVINPVLYLAGEFVVRKGDMGTTMFFVHLGEVEVFAEDTTLCLLSMRQIARKREPRSLFLIMIE